MHHVSDTEQTDSGPTGYPEVYFNYSIHNIVQATGIWWQRPANTKPRAAHARWCTAICIGFWFLRPLIVGRSVSPSLVGRLSSRIGQQTVSRPVGSVGRINLRSVDLATGRFVWSVSLLVSLLVGRQGELTGRSNTAGWSVSHWSVGSASLLGWLLGLSLRLVSCLVSALLPTFLVQYQMFVMLQCDIKSDKAGRLMCSR
jgi:hypothetical protein